jgi:hypothetical protein
VSRQRVGGRLRTKPLHGKRQLSKRGIRPSILGGWES